MACQYFKEAYVGFCSASDIPYVPSIREMEQLCFKDSCVCSILTYSSCNEFQGADIPAA